MTGQQHPLWTKGFLILTFCSFLLFLNLQMVVSTLPAYVKEQFGAGDISIGMITGLFALSAIIARLYAGRPSQKHRMAGMLLIGLSIALAATAGAYWCHALIAVLFIRMLYGFGFGVASTMLPTIASNRIPLQRMGEGMGYFGFSNTLGLSMGPLIGMTLLAQYGFGTLTAAASLTLILILPLFYGVLPRIRQAPEQHPEATVTSLPANRFFSSKLAMPALLNTLLSFTYGGLVSFIALYGIEKHIEGVGSFFLIQCTMVLLVRPFAGKMFDRKGPAGVMLPGGLLVFLGLILISYSDRLIDLILSAAVFGSGYGMIQPSAQAWMIKQVRQEERGMANGMFYNSIDVGVGLGSILSGIAASSVGYSMMYRLSSLFMVLFIIIFGYSLIAARRARDEASHNF